MEKQTFLDKYSPKNSLTDEQKQIFKLVDNKDNVFISGIPGSGKSYVLTYIIKHLLSNNIPIGVTASTGCSAINLGIGAQTLHSYFGLTPFIKDYNDYAKNIKIKRKDIFFKLLKLKCLIIEEISMIDNILFEGISHILKYIKNNDKPFGNIQLIFVGDFYQLKPIENDYCFISDEWNNIGFKHFILTKSIRQDGDDEFIHILSSIRKGIITDDILKKLEQLKNTTFPKHIKPTKLFPKNNEVDMVNQHKLLKLGQPLKTFKAIFKNIKDNQDYDITLCINAQIMITRNIDIDSHIINGTRGVVIDINNTSVKIKLFNDTEYLIEYVTDFLNIEQSKSVNFMPLKLAYALSIHKSQGCTLDCMEIDLGKNIFEKGQAYVALSRGKNFKNIKIIDLDKNSFKVDQKVLDNFV